MADLRYNLPLYMFIDALGGTTWAPCKSDMMIIQKEEWEEIVERVAKFYNAVTPEDIDADNRGQRKYERKAVKKSNKRSRSRSTPDNSGFVYVLQAGPYYKIGRAKNVNNRVKQLATLPPFDVVIIHTIKTQDSYELELQLHGRFDNKHKNGEWFELDEEDVTWLKTL